MSTSALLDPVPATPTTRSRFPFLTFRQALDRAQERPTFLVPGLVSSTLTLFIGEPEAGKSSLAGALVRAALTNGPFLGREFGRAISRVFVLTTEVDGPEEMAGRLHEEGVDDAAELTIVPLSAVTSGDWTDLGSAIEPDLGTLVVVDNLNGVVPEGSTNTDDTVRQVNQGVRLLTEAGAAVVLLHHTSDKSGPNGGKSALAMGHTSISGMGRWTVFVAKGQKVGTLKLKCHGNGAPTEEMTLTREPGRGALALVVASQASAADLETRQRERDAARGQQLAEAAFWAVEHHRQAATAADMSRALVARFPWLAGGADPARTVASQLSSGRKIGAYLTRGDDGWQVTGNTS